MWEAHISQLYTWVNVCCLLIRIACVLLPRGFHICHHGQDASSFRRDCKGFRTSEGNLGHRSSSEPGCTGRHTCRWSCSWIHTGDMLPSSSTWARCTKLQSKGTARSGEHPQRVLSENPQLESHLSLKYLGTFSANHLDGDSIKFLFIPIHNDCPMNAPFRTYLVQPELCSQAHTSAQGPRAHAEINQESPLCLKWSEGKNK